MGRGARIQANETAWAKVQKQEGSRHVQPGRGGGSRESTRLGVRRVGFETRLQPHLTETEFLIWNTGMISLCI